MPDNRYFVENLFAPVTLSDAEFLHMTRVMRKKEGDRVELIDGKGHLAHGIICALRAREADISIEECLSYPRPLTLMLVIALPKQGKIDWIVEKGTELGVTQFLFFKGDRSEKADISSNQQERLHRLLIMAIKQSGALYLPSQRQLVSLDELKETNVPLYFGDFNARCSLHDVALPAAVVIGPESGFSPRELKTLSAIAKGVNLGPLTLRAETAAIAAAAILSCRFASNSH